LVEYAKARSAMAQAEEKMEGYIADIDSIRNELQRWKEHGGAIELRKVPSAQDLSKSVADFNAAREVAERAARNLPEVVRGLFQPF
jgi:hypothetical protein